MLTYVLLLMALLSPLYAHSGMIASKQHKTSFSHVMVDGVINVNLHTHYKHPGVQLHGDPRDVAYVQIKRVGDRMSVYLGKGYPHFGPVTADISTPHLRSFTYHGNGAINGTHLHSTCVDILINNQGRAQLSGQLSLRNMVVTGDGYTVIKGIKSPSLHVKMAQKAHLQLDGDMGVSSIDIENDAWLNLFWVKSQSLVIRQYGNAYLQLAGIVNKLDLEAWDNARFNGRYLRARSVFAKTHGRALAEITALTHQHTLALDRSDIAFYAIPETKADFMAFNGAVLDQRDLSFPFIQP